MRAFISQWINNIIDVFALGFLVPITKTPILVSAIKRGSGIGCWLNRRYRQFNRIGAVIGQSRKIKNIVFIRLQSRANQFRTFVIKAGIFFHASAELENIAHIGGAVAAQLIGQLEDILFHGLIGFVFGQHIADFRQKAIGQFLIRQLFPVDDAVNEVDGLPIAGKGQQNAAIQNGQIALIDEFRFKSDRGLIGQNLHVVIGNPAQQRQAGHIGQNHHLRVCAAFCGKFVA